jgi:hypothetical protein
MKGFEKLVKKRLAERMRDILPQFLLAADQVGQEVWSADVGNGLVFHLVLSVVESRHCFTMQLRWTADGLKPDKIVSKRTYGEGGDVDVNIRGNRFDLGCLFSVPLTLIPVTL